MTELFYKMSDWQGIEQINKSTWFFECYSIRKSFCKLNIWDWDTLLYFADQLPIEIMFKNNCKTWFHQLTRTLTIETKCSIKGWNCLNSSGKWSHYITTFLLMSTLTIASSFAMWDEIRMSLTHFFDYSRNSACISFEWVSNTSAVICVHWDGGSWDV